MSSIFSLPGKISLAALFSYSAAVIAAPPADSAYVTDPQQSHVEDATSDGIQQVNMITCYMSSMRPDALVNDGPYIALVDQNKCDSSSQSSASNSGSTSDGSQAANYQSSVVNSTRASLNDPMIAGIWVDQSDGNSGPGTIYVHLSASQAPTDANPYGQFRLDFCGLMDANPGSCSMRGFMEGADGSLKFYQDEQRGPGQTSNTALELSSVGTTSGSGGLTTIQSDSGSTVPTSFLFAYDQNHFLRGDQCFSRDASDPATGMSVWSYGLYDSGTGARINLNSGFPIQYTSGGTTYQGYMGYWGLSLPQDAMATLATGSTVQKVDYNDNSAPTLTNYSVLLAGGKLTKYTKKATTLNAIDQIEIDTWVNDATNLYSGAPSNTQYEIHWDDASGMFIVDAQMNCGQNGCQAHTLDTPQSVDPSFWQQAQNGVQGFSQSLGGDVFIDLSNISTPVVSSAVPVLYHTQNIVYPSDPNAPTTLYCVQDCLTAATLQAFFTQGSSASSPYTAASFNNWNPAAAVDVVTYTNDSQHGVLTSGGQAAVFTDASAYQQSPQYQGGVRSGPLVDTLASEECSTGSGTYCNYKANDLDYYYIWETGPNNWNQLAVVKDSSNQAVQFDPPLQVTYDVPNTSAYGQYAGKSIVLQYGGFGNLWGIPGDCVSNLTNQPVSCDAGNNVRYVPQFAIPYDATLGAVSDGAHTYLVKWLDREIRFASKPLSDCNALTLPSQSDITLPTSADVKNPADPASDIYIGSKPDVTDAPRVIQGEVMY